MSPPDSATATAVPHATLAAVPAKAPAYRRILLKLSGEALMGEASYGIERQTIDRIVAEIGEVVRLGVQVAVVIGGGNIFRGVAPGHGCTARRPGRSAAPIAPATRRRHAAARPAARARS